jgi:putative oxidoreductase
MTSLALLFLRLVVGGLVAGRGAQKLFGAKPPKEWALVAGVSELAGGGLTALGLLSPIGPLLAVGSMATATLTHHRDKPIWGTKGGAELPVTNMAALAALVLAGPGVLSLDSVFGTRVPWWFSFLTLTGVAIAVASATASKPLALPAPKMERVGGPVPWDGERVRENAEANG